MYPYIHIMNDAWMYSYLDGSIYARRVLVFAPYCVYYAIHTQIEFYETSTTHSFHSCTETRPPFLSHSFQAQPVMCDWNGKYFYYVMAFVEPIRRASVEVSLALAPSRSVRARSLEAFDFRVATYASLLACVSSLLMQKFHDGRS